MEGISYNLLFNNNSSLFITEYKRKNFKEKVKQTDKKEKVNLFINDFYYEEIETDTIAMLSLEIGQIGLFKGFDVIGTYKQVSNGGNKELQLLMYMYNLSREYLISREKELKELERKNRG